MVNKDAHICGVHRSTILFTVIALAFTAILTTNLPPRLRGCPECPRAEQLPCKQTDTPKQERNELPLTAVPDVPDVPDDERRLMEKAVLTDYENIWMGSPEINLVLRYLHGSTTYLEWGSGGSTVNFARWPPRAVSIEHNKEWCGQMQDKIAADKNLSHIDYRCIEVEPDELWEGGFAEGDYRTFSKYVDEIDNVGIKLYDFILIDGRARVDCSIKVLSYLRKNSIVVLHDAVRIWGYGGYYSGVKEYYDLMEYIGGKGKQGIAIMKRKDSYASLQGNNSAVMDILYKKYPTMKEDTGPTEDIEPDK